MSIDQLTAEALRLPARERALLAGSLWDSLGDPPDASNEKDDAAVVALALEREREIESGRVKAVSHEEIMAKFRR